jgi:2-oxoglutarate ferredoxin oxidoreductase subunit beta
MSCITPTSIKSPIAPTWCPGCGDFIILNSLQKAVSDLQLEEENLVIVNGIGCAGNMADFNRCYGFHSLHGRALASAIGMKLANHNLKIIVIAGDGDIYGEGLSHFIEACRGNHDLTLLVHNNGRYSLTTGQASPTSKKGLKAKSTPTGLIEEPLNPLLLALSTSASFVARGYSAKPVQLIELIKKAIQHPGFALVDIMQLCPSFNKEMNHPWFTPLVYELSETDHDSHNFQQALAKTLEPDKIPLGIYFEKTDSIPYHQQVPQLQKGSLLSQFSNQINLQAAWSKMI